MRWIVFLLAPLALACSAAAQPSPWPGGQRAAIALTYDDAVVSQLDVAIPQLDAAGLKGTFFLTGRNIAPDAVARWRAAAANGHELGNHAMVHPCLRGSFDMPAPYQLENYTVQTMLNEIGAMNSFLTAIDGKPAHAYATPCGQNLAGGEDYVGPLEASGLSTYIRDERATPPPGTPQVLATGFENASGAEMIAWAERVRAAGGLGVVVFHGVGGDYIAVSGEAHREFVDYLAAHRSEYWVAPFSEVLDRVRANAAP